MNLRPEALLYDVSFWSSVGDDFGRFIYHDFVYVLYDSCFTFGDFGSVDLLLRLEIMLGDSVGHVQA
jgi:hypothetical protein